MPSDLVELANSQVPMLLACRAAGMKIDEFTSKKLYCPFGEFSHADGGEEAAFRVYSDHAFCFACWAYYSPVSLCATVWEVTEEQVAQKLLTMAGITPESYEERWEELQQDQVVDTRAVFEALRTRCERNFPCWASIQYNDQVARYLARCKALLPAVKTEEDARQWLETCSQIMNVVVRRADAQAPGRPGLPRLRWASR
jgi:hypothetical protein